MKTKTSTRCGVRDLRNTPDTTFNQYIENVKQNKNDNAAARTKWPKSLAHKRIWNSEHQLV